MIKVLIVEDRFHIREILHMFLERLGEFDIVSAKNGDEAVTAVRKDPDIDIVLMDMYMPVMNGDVATRNIRKFSQVPIIAITAFSDDKTRQKAKDAGMDLYLVKPVDYQDLASRILELTKAKEVLRTDRGQSIAAQIKAKVRRLNHLAIRKAKQGPDFPIALEIEIEDTQAEIAGLQQELAND